jgi:UDP-glucose 4-epimerase
MQNDELNRIFDSKRILVTGGSGFIGSHLIDSIVESSCEIHVIDDLSSGNINNIENHILDKRITFYEIDMSQTSDVLRIFKNSYFDEIWHLASNTDIISSHLNPSRDLFSGTVSSFTVCEMARLGITDKVLFSSSGAVYGNSCENNYVTEIETQLSALSTYAASKISAESLFEAYSNLYDTKTFVFRFGNVIGNRITHGVIFDFIESLKTDPSILLIKGDGKQEKNYFLVDDCVDGMIQLSILEYGSNYNVLNLGTPTTTKVTDIAKFVVEAMGLINTQIQIEGTKLAWPGDQPRVHFSVEKAKSLGWVSSYSSDDAVKIAIKRMLTKQ